MTDAQIKGLIIYSCCIFAFNFLFEGGFYIHQKLSLSLSPQFSWRRIIENCMFCWAGLFIGFVVFK